MKLIILLLLLVIVTTSKAENRTRFQRRNVFLSRRKRYVQWPKGSNFVINFSCSKPLLRYQPLTWNTVYEMDVPFAVPPDNKIFFNQGTRTKRHIEERRNMLDHLDDFMTMMGFNGRLCVNRLLCESKEFVKTGSKTMFRELVKVLFSSFPGNNESAEYSVTCDEGTISSCPVSLLSIFINSSDGNESNVATNNISIY